MQLDPSPGYFGADPRGSRGAQLNVQFTDPLAPGDPSQGTVRFAVETAFNEWTRHFDYTAWVLTINVSFRAAVQPVDVSLSAQDFTKVGNDPVFLNAVEPSFGLSFAARDASPTIFGTSLFQVNLATPTLRLLPPTSWRDTIFHENR